MKNPVIILNLSSLASILKEIELKKYVSSPDGLANQILLRGLGLSPEHLPISVQSANPLPQDVQTIVKWFDTYKKKYSGNPFSTQIETGSTLFKTFTKYTALLNQKHKEYREAGGVKNFDCFVGCFMQFSFERGRVSQRKFTVSNLFGEEALAGGESGMTDLLVIESHKNESYLSFLIQEMNRVFGYSYYSTLEGDAKNKAKLIIAIDHLLSSRKENADSSPDTVKKLISLWVISAYEGFSKLTGKRIITRQDFDIAVGFISGTEQGETNTAVTRYKDKIRTLIEHQIKPYDTQ